MKTFTIGDMHGGHKALLQCLERSHFDYDNDRLICLGDVADGWPDVVECFEELLKIKHLVFVRGNHDQWLLNYLKYEDAPSIWLTQGGRASFLSFNARPELKEKFGNFLADTPFYFIDEQNNLYVHGGVDREHHVSKQGAEDVMWDRSLWYQYTSKYPVDMTVPLYNRVFVGHTTTWKNSQTPVIADNVVFMDTGGGWEGKLSIMNVDTLEYFQSDRVEELYPDGHN